MYDYYTHIFIFDYMVYKKSWQLIKSQKEIVKMVSNKSNSLTDSKDMPEKSGLQHNDDDLDWAYRPYLYTNTRTNYDSSPMEGELES